MRRSNLGARERLGAPARGLMRFGTGKVLNFDSSLSNVWCLVLPCDVVVCGVWPLLPPAVSAAARQLSSVSVRGVKSAGC